MRRDPLRSVPIRLALTALFLTPLGAGLWLELPGLTSAGFLLVFVFILATYGYDVQRWERREEVQRNMRRILAERRARERERDQEEAGQ
jgi:hypothetical protein